MMTMRMGREPAMRLIVVEDEELQRVKLVSWLIENSNVVVIDVAADGPDAVAKIDAQRPDVVLLDVSLPTMTGIDVLARVRHKPDVVFTTAYRDYAIEAFELGAVDYLLKPFGRQRLEAALSRVRARHASAAVADENISERVAAMMDEQRPLDRLFVRYRGAVIPISVQTIVRLEADGDYTAVHADGRRHLVALPLKVLHARIRSENFVRIHRRHVINLARMAAFDSYDDGRVRVSLRGGQTIIASRAGSQVLRKLARE